MIISRKAAVLLLLLQNPTISASFQIPPTKKISPIPTSFTQTYLSDKNQENNSNSSNTNKNQKKKHISAAEQERRDEEKRRSNRRNDVIIGKTSALPNEKDFPLNPTQTEQQLLDTYTIHDKEHRIHVMTNHGLDCLKMLQLEDARDAFDEVYALKPDAYVFQAGVVMFYLNKFHAAAELFAKNAIIYENRFGCPASEERIWRDACELKLLSGMGKKERLMVKERGGLPEIPAWEPPLGALEGGETRRVVRHARDLFGSTVANDTPTAILSRAGLKSIGMAETRYDNRMWKMLSWYYLGLHYDAIGEDDQSKKCMKYALKMTNGSMNSNDVTQCLPVIHMSRRDWYDDEEFDADATDDFTLGDNEGTLEESIMAGVAKMKVGELKEALKRRSITYSGKTKAALVDCLVESLLKEAGVGMFPRPGPNQFQ